MFNYSPIEVSSNPKFCGGLLQTALCFGPHSKEQSAFCLYILALENCRKALDLVLFCLML